MHYRRVGKWGVKVSAIGLGSYLTIGDRLTEEVSRTLVGRALARGVTFFDTANAYNAGAAESTLGLLLAGVPRDSLVLATKVWAPMGPGPNDRGLSRKHVTEQCHASLRRLRTEYVDIYQCHRFDAETPLEETIRAIADLIRQGRVLYWGVSEWSVPQQQAALEICTALGIDPPISNQPRYNLLWRDPELAVFPFGRRHGLGQFIFSPLAHGVLSGKYPPDAAPRPGTRASSSDNAVMMDLYYKPDILRRVETLAAMAAARGITAAQLAIAWILRNDAVSSVIAGVTRLEQLDDNLAALDVTIDDEMAERLSELFPRPETVGTTPW